MLTDVLKIYLRDRNDNTCYPLEVSTYMLTFQVI